MPFGFIQQNHMDILKSFTLKQVAGWTIASDLINYIMQKTFSWLCQTKYVSPLPKRSRHSNIIPGNPLVFTKDAVIPTCTLQLPPRCGWILPNEVTGSTGVSVDLQSALLVSNTKR